jgi:hypothetical protein
MVVAVNKTPVQQHEMMRGIAESRKVEKENTNEILVYYLDPEKANYCMCIARIGLPWSINSSQPNTKLRIFCSRATSPVVCCQ